MLEFEQILEEDPGNQACRLAYADWCEEHGREAYGRALRYLATNERHPVLLPEGTLPRPWLFGDPENGGKEPHWAPCKLDWDVHRLLVKVVGRNIPAGSTTDRMWDEVQRGIAPPFSVVGWTVFTTQQQATEYLGRALEAGCPQSEGV
jgi:uncharacterized protein (TIGR02996 family)